VTGNDGMYLIESEEFVRAPEVPPNPMLDDPAEVERMLALTRESISNPDVWPLSDPPD
jgi:hypothetical protein